MGYVTPYANGISQECKGLHFFSENTRCLVPEISLILLLLKVHAYTLGHFFVEFIDFSETFQSES